MAFPSSAQLKRALTIRLKLEALENELQALMGAHQGNSSSNGAGRRGMSAASRARIAAAQRARWAKVKAGAKPGKRTRRKMSAAAKAKLAAIARKRWRKAKAAGKTAL